MLYRSYSQHLPAPPEPKPWMLRLSWTSISLLLLAALSLGGLNLAGVKTGSPFHAASGGAFAGLSPK